MCAYDIVWQSNYKVNDYILYRYHFFLISAYFRCVIRGLYLLHFSRYPHPTTSTRYIWPLGTSIPNFKALRVSVHFLHEFLCHYSHTERSHFWCFFGLEVLMKMCKFFRLSSKIILAKNQFHVWETLEMRKNIVRFGSTSGRGVSKCWGHRH